MSTWTQPLILGARRPHQLTELFGTGYDEFESPIGIRGLAKEEDGALHLLAVHTDAPGKGQFGRLIELAKGAYQAIYVWEIWQPWLALVLERYGFEKVQIKHPVEEMTAGMGWRRESD